MNSRERTTRVETVDTTGLTEVNKQRGAQVFNALMQNPAFKQFLQGTGEFDLGDQVYPLWGMEPAQNVVKWLSRQNKRIVVLAFESKDNAFSKKATGVDVMTFRSREGRGHTPREDETIVDFIKRIK